MNDVNDLRLALFKLKERLDGYCIDHGCMGESYPFKDEVLNIKRMIKFLERYQ